MKLTELMQHARTARAAAYAPYSGYQVGAALLAADGRVFLGCNIENAALTPTCCAERVAIFRAVAEGVRDFSAIAVAGGPAGNAPAACTPCGVCRQVLREFCNPDTFQVYAFDGKEERSYTLSELLPLSFGPENLAREGE